MNIDLKSALLCHQLNRNTNNYSDTQFKYDILIFIRYLSLGIIIFSLVSTKSRILSLIEITSLFLFIINNQVRYFIFKDYKLIVLISFVFEICLITTLTKLYPYNIAFYFIPILIDITSLIKHKIKYIFIAFIFIFEIYISFFYNKAELFNSLSILLIVYALLFYSNREYSSKKNAQMLYDKLRISEEKLKKANLELEDYSHTIEELTLLKERNRLSREIHDSVGHALSTTMIQLNAIEAISMKNNLEILPLVTNLKNFVGESYQEVRNAVRAIKPPEYSNYQDIIKIQDLINNFTKLSGINVKLTISETKYPLDSKVSLAVYRLIQESLSNASRHGKATKISVTLIYNKNDLSITIKDNGIGCSNVNYGVGLTSITERFKEFNGDVSFNTSKGNGFVIKIIVPRIVGDQYVK